MSARADVVVLGASVDGLVAAAHLAASGREVVVLEPRANVGGVAAAEEFHPGFTAPGLVHDDHLVRRAALAGLGAERHGLGWRRPPRLLVAGEDGAGLSLAREAEDMRPALSGDDALDVAAYGHWRSQLTQWQPFVREALDATPPEVVAPTKRALLAFAQKGLELRRLPEKGLHELLRVAAMPARDWLDEHFHHPLLRAGLVAPALTPTVLGPRAAGTALLVLLRECAAGDAPTGGLPALARAVAAAGRSLGVELRLGVAPERVLLDHRGVQGVALSTGETIETHVVLSALDVRATLRGLVRPGAATERDERAAAAWRARGAVAVVRLALSAAPRFRGREGEDVERCVTAASLDVLERAADALKYGEVAERPWLDVRVPTHADPSLAPPGQHVATLLVHGVATTTGADDQDAARELVAQRALAELERVAPGVGDAVLARDVLLPRDLEARYGLTGGHLFGGELALDQLWLRRPSLPLSRYRTGVPGLFLCGASSHPGGPYLAGAGHLAARAAAELPRNR